MIYSKIPTRFLRASTKNEQDEAIIDQENDSFLEKLKIVNEEGMDENDYDEIVFEKIPLCTTREFPQVFFFYEKIKPLHISQPSSIDVQLELKPALLEYCLALAHAWNIQDLTGLDYIMKFLEECILTVISMLPTSSQKIIKSISEGDFKNSSEFLDPKKDALSKSVSRRAQVVLAKIYKTSNFIHTLCKETEISRFLQSLSTTTTLVEGYATLKILHGFTHRKSTLQILKQLYWEVAVFEFFCRLPSLQLPSTQLLAMEEPSVLEIVTGCFFFALHDNDSTLRLLDQGFLARAIPLLFCFVGGFLSTPITLVNHCTAACIKVQNQCDLLRICLLVLESMSFAQITKEMYVLKKIQLWVTEINLGFQGKKSSDVRIEIPIGQDDRAEVGSIEEGGKFEQSEREEDKTKIFIADLKEKISEKLQEGISKFKPSTSQQHVPLQQNQWVARVCAACGELETRPQEFKTCRGCHELCYCSKRCQKGDWPKHKMECSAK